MEIHFAIVKRSVKIKGNVQKFIFIPSIIVHIPDYLFEFYTTDFLPTLKVFVIVETRGRLGDKNSTNAVMLNLQILILPGSRFSMKLYC